MKPRYLRLPFDGRVYGAGVHQRPYPGNIMTRVLFGLTTVAFVLSACQTTPSQNDDVSGLGDADSELITGALSTGDIDGLALDRPVPTLEWVSYAYGDRVLFDSDSAGLTTEGQEIVRGWADWMKMFPDIVVRIEGHCDERGTREYNLALGEKRATAVRNLLIALGVAPHRIAVVSYGKERPVVAGHTAESWSENRRGVLTLI